MLLIASVVTVLLLSTLDSRAYAFTNGQSASIVIGQKDFASAEIATSQKGLILPVKVVFDPSGNLWVGDAGNNRVLEFRPPFSTDMEASLVIGQPNFTAGAPATTQSGLRGQVFDEGVMGLGFDSSGNLWVADSPNNRVLEFKTPFSIGISASSVIGQKDFDTALQGGSRDGLNFPSAVAFDRSDNLWVLDQFNNRVLEFKPPFSDGMNASLVIGQIDFETSASSTTQSGLGGGVIGDLAIDPSGNLWVGDAGNNRVLEFKLPFSSGMNASLVIGQASFVTKSSSMTESGLTGFYGAGVAFDPTGNLWVGDTYNNRILEFQPPFSPGMDASLVIGQQNFRTSTSSTSQSGLSAPSHLGFDSSGNLWVPDYSNNRVLEFSSSSSSVTPTTSSTAQTSTASSTTTTQSSLTSVTAATTDQRLGQLQNVAAGVAVLVAAIGLIAVFLRSRRSKK